MINYNNLSDGDTKPEPDSFHEGFGAIDEKSKKKSKKSKRLAGVVLASEKDSTTKETDRSVEVAEKSKSLIDQLIRKEETDGRLTPVDKPSEGALEKTEVVERDFAIPGEIEQSGLDDLSATEQVSGGSVELRDSAVAGSALESGGPERALVSSDEAADELLKTVEKTADAAATEEPHEFNEVPTAAREETADEDGAVLKASSASSTTASTAAGVGRGSHQSGSASNAGGSSGGSSGSSSATGSSGSGGGGASPPGGGASSGSSGSAGAPRPGRWSRRFAQGMNTPVPPQWSAGNILTQPAANTAESAEDSYRRGRRKGFITGLVVGGGVEHIRHKRREKRMEKASSQKLQEQSKQHEKAIEDMQWTEIREKEASKLRAEAAAKHSQSAERPRVEVTTNTEARAVAERIAEQVDKKGISGAPKPESGGSTGDKVKLTSAELVELDRQREALDLAKGHRVESSAWHRIEVDEHGRAVQGGSVEYGHEYYREKAQERGMSSSKTKPHLDEAAGEVALVAAAMSEGLVDQHWREQQSSTSSDAGPRKKRGGGAVPAMFGAAGGASAGVSASTRSDRSSASSSPTSLLRSVASPPTTTAGTVAWLIVLILLLLSFAIVITR